MFTKFRTVQNLKQLIVFFLAEQDQKGLLNSLYDVHITSAHMHPVAIWLSLETYKDIYHTDTYTSCCMGQSCYMLATMKMMEIIFSNVLM